MPAPRPPLPVAVVTAMGLGYLVPSLTTAANTLLVPDPVVADRLFTAAWTTIPIPGAVAAGLVTVWTHRLRPPARPGARASARAFGIAALACLFLTTAASAVLVGNGVLPLADLQFVLPSGAIGGGMAARRWARAGRRARRARRVTAGEPAPLPL